MAIAAASAFSDLLDPRFFRIAVQAFDEEKDMRDLFYSRRQGTQETERWSEVSGLGDMVAFGGSLVYDVSYQGYDGQATQQEFALGTQIERRFWELEQFNYADKLASELGRSARKTQQKHAARIFNLAFGTDNQFGSHSEGVPLCDDAHTTTVPGVSTATGFDNRITADLSPGALTDAIIQFRKFKTLEGEPIDERPTHLIVPIDLEARAQEILQTRQGLDTTAQNINVHFGALELVSWHRLTDTNNWFLINQRRMKENVFWFDVVEPEFGSMEAFDQIVAKYRVYAMYTLGRADWRWILGAEVS